MSPRATGPLGAARVGVAVAWVAVVTLAVFAVAHPIVLVAILVSVLGAAALSGCGRPVLRAVAFTLPLALAVLLLNAVLSRDGLTVVARLGEAPVIGRLDLTSEALAWGAILAVRAVGVAAVVAIFAVSVDQDELVGSLRRRSGRLGLSTALAARMMPLLVADGKRLLEARRALPGSAAPSRGALFNAITSGALDRAGDAAASLELRGLGSGPCLAPRPQRPWSRHDISLIASTLGIGALLAIGWLGRLSEATFLPTVVLAPAAGAITIAAAVAVVIVLPFVGRRGLGR